MKNYVIMKDAEDKIASIKCYDEHFASTEEIKKRISEWEGKETYELVDDEKQIDILDYYFRRNIADSEDNDLKARCEKLETVLEEIESLVTRVM